MGPSPPIPSSATIGVRPFATVGAAGFLSSQGPATVESDWGSLAAHWESMRSAHRSHEADQVREDEFIEHSSERRGPEAPGPRLRSEPDSGLVFEVAVH